MTDPGVFRGGAERIFRKNAGISLHLRTGVPWRALSAGIGLFVGSGASALLGAPAKLRRGRRKRRRAKKNGADHMIRAVWLGKKKAGSVLLSHLSAVSSAKGCLTSVFGTGTGISTSLWPPAFNKHIQRRVLRCPAIQKIQEEGIVSNGNDNMAKPHDLLVLLG